MLTAIHLLNFKSFFDQKLSLKPMTLLAGLNNSGKSSIIQALRMLWKWSERGDPTLPGLGYLKDIKNIGASSDRVKVSCCFKGHEIAMQIVVTDSGQSALTSYNTSWPQLPFMSYVSADRWGPRVTLPMFKGAGEVANVGEYGEYMIDFLSRHERDIVPPLLRHHNAEGETLEYNVSAWLEEIAPGVKFKHGNDPKRDISYATIGEFRPTNTGFGLSYTLPVIISLLGMAAEWEDKEKQQLKTEQGTLVLLENPEAHLHPRGQTSIGRLIALAAVSGVQIIVETHSDHLMDGIRIAVKEGKLNSDMTVFHYLTLEKDGFTSVETPTLQPNGKLDFWPKGFFDQTMHNRAILSRR